MGFQASGEGEKAETHQSGSDPTCLLHFTLQKFDLSYLLGVAEKGASQRRDLALKTFLKFLLGWVVGAISTTALAVFLQTQNVIARLGNIGADISMGDRVSMSLYDLMHLGSLYIVFVAAGTLVAYLAGLLVYRLAGFGRPIVFAVAGAVAMLVMLLLMKEAFFGVHLIAGARDMVGIGLQMLAGGLGGLLFERITRQKAGLKL